MKTIVWLRQDLRLSDNPALHAATERGEVYPLYILDDVNAKEEKMGAASRWWLHYSLSALSEALKGHLSLFSGDPLPFLKKFIKEQGISAIYWNRCYEPWRIQRDKTIKKALKEEGIEVKSFKGSLLWEPLNILKSDGTPYRVFTPFYKACQKEDPPRKPFPHPKLKTAQLEGSLTLDQLNLLPKKSWSKKLEGLWEIGEAGAEKAAQKFLKIALATYKKERDYPGREGVSRLSPHLHFGEISPHQIFAAAHQEKESVGLNHFISELGWREFSYYLLYHFPTLPNKNFQSKFDSFPWQNSPSHLKKWQKGMTGIPMVDAGMRELWETGYMHNRSRMIVGSFLVKNLLLDWRAGERWFWDCLVDADLASNSASWQWVAGCGADAAPYFRIFNPITQGEKFDPDGVYIHRFVPELANLPPPSLFAPWTAPKEELEKAGITLGKTYPYPIVDLKKSREKALKAFSKIKGTS
ncbi:MAG: deoxyribodipyrimidine photo-lyase [Chlamydiia bacterium]|nr:deoxyribodipyrimidine photo-lyase [Chlamydiia bacterium]